MYRAGYKTNRNILNKIASKVEIGPYFFMFTLVLFVALITVITLTNSTKQVTKGYMLNSLDAEHQELVKNQQVMDMKISDVRSLNFIQSSNKVRYMNSPEIVVFVSGETSIASAR